jgi:hypothetical protein
MAYFKDRYILMFKFLCFFFSSLLLSATLSAQSFPSAEGPRLTVSAGAEISLFNPDYGCKDNSPFMCFGQQLLGVAPFVDANHLFFQRLGAEGEARFLHWRGPGGGLTESSYMAGPRVGLIGFRRSIYLSAKVLVGSANINIPKSAAGNGTHLAYAPGAVAEFKVTRRLTARVDYEYQIWPNFIGSGGLTPNGFSLGLSYMILRPR